MWGAQAATAQRTVKQQAGTMTFTADAIAEAAKLVKTAQAPPPFKAPGPTFDASKAKGKTIFYIANYVGLDFTKDIIKNLTDAVTPLGVKVIVRDNLASPQTTSQLIDQAITQHANVILIQSMTSSAITTALKRAKAANIPVIQMFEYDPKPVPAAEQALGVVGEVAFCYACGGRLMADWVVADSKGKPVGAASWFNPEVGVGINSLGGMKGEFKRLGCNCTFKHIYGDPFSQIATKTALEVAAALQDPSIGYLMPVYDVYDTYIVPAVHHANKQDSVKFVSFNANPPAMKLMKQHDVVWADVGSPTPWYGWGLADQALRVLSGVKPVVDENIPLRMFTRDNVNGLNLNVKPSGGGYGNDVGIWYGTNYKAGYSSLWKH
jgi:ribose transport system substrate-binding protein